MTNLTDKWRKGELESGWYYVNYYSIDGAVMQEYLPQHNGFGYDEKNLVQEVLAPVPSYIELQSMNEAVNQAMAANIKLVEQNKQLKDLLKECRDELKFMYDTYGQAYLKPFDDILIDKIDEVLKCGKRLNVG